MKHWITAMLLLATLVAGRVSADAGGEAEADAWAGYLDFAYVYSSAEPEALAARLREYGRETHQSLQDYTTRRLQTGAAEGDDADEAVTRRLASSAAASARRQDSSGAAPLNSASTPSPMNLSTSPPASWIASTTASA